MQVERGGQECRDETLEGVTSAVLLHGGLYIARGGDFGSDTRIADPAVTAEFFVRHGKGTTTMPGPIRQTRTPATRLHHQGGDRPPYPLIRPVASSARLRHCPREDRDALRRDVNVTAADGQGAGLPPVHPSAELVLGSVRGRHEQGLASQPAVEPRADLVYPGAVLLRKKGTTPPDRSRWWTGACSAVRAGDT